MSYVQSTIREARTGGDADEFAHLAVSCFVWPLVTAAFGRRGVLPGVCFPGLSLRLWHQHDSSVAVAPPSCGQDEPRGQLARSTAALAPLRKASFLCAGLSDIQSGKYA